MMEIVLPPIHLCTNREEFDLNMATYDMPAREWLDDQAGACVHNLYHEDTGPFFIVSIRMQQYEHHDNISTACMLVHEAVHVWQLICQHYGEDAAGMENEAYSIQAISDNLMRQYVARKWKKSRGGWVDRYPAKKEASAKAKPRRRNTLVCNWTSL